MKNEIVHYESFIKWEDNVPTVYYREMLTKEVVADLPVAALSLPYKRTDREIFLNKDPEFEGKTNAEVMHIQLARKAAYGNLEAIKLLQDRILGKPKQSIETKSISITYADYLEHLSKEVNEEEILEAKMSQL